MATNQTLSRLCGTFPLVLYLEAVLLHAAVPKAHAMIITITIVCAGSAYACLPGGQACSTQS